MADLGTVNLFGPVGRPITLVPVTDYNVERGRFLGAVTVLELTPPIEFRPMGNYVVRALQVIFRQLWPSKGQRFPQ